MNIEVQKDMVIECLRLGMPEEKAYLYAEFSDEDIDKLKADKEFQKRVTFVTLDEERRLLKMFDECMNITHANGDSKDIKHKLMIIDKDRYGTGSASTGAGKDGKKRFKMNINFSKSTVSLEEDNVEIGGAAVDGADPDGLRTDG